MTIDANLLEGVKIGMLLGFIVGIAVTLLIAWAVSYGTRLDDDK
jgi:gas vesicle protein